MKEKDKNVILNLAQEQIGTANLESNSVWALAKSFFKKILQVFAMTRLPVGSKVRCSLERLRGVQIGKHVFLAGGNILDRARPDLITIEDYVSLAGSVYILTHSNPTKPLREILGPESHKIAPVFIKKGAWVAVNCIIMPGVTIGENSIVAAGSVVNRDVPPLTIVGGSPAKIIRRINSTNQGE